MPLNINFNGHKIKNERKVFLDGNPAQLSHDTFYDGDSFEVHTEINKQGTKITEGTDYVLSGQDQDLTERASRPVYTMVQIVNEDYIEEELFFHYLSIGDFVNAKDVAIPIVPAIIF
jgi:hypothetical protein